MIKVLMIVKKLFETFQLKHKPEPTTCNNFPVEDNITEDAISYVDAGNVIYHADGSSITDKEIPYLKQIGRDKAIAEFNYPQNIRLIKESYQIMYDTTDPKTLCDRYKTAKNHLNELNHYLNQGLISNSTDLIRCNELLSNNNYCSLVIWCYKKYINKANIELKTKKGVNDRLNKFWIVIQDSVDIETYIKLRSSLTSYKNDQMPPKEEE